MRQILAAYVLDTADRKSRSRMVGSICLSFLLADVVRPDDRKIRA